MPSVILNKYPNAPDPVTKMAHYESELHPHSFLCSRLAAVFLIRPPDHNTTIIHCNALIITVLNILRREGTRFTTWVRSPEQVCLTFDGKLGERWWHIGGFVISIGLQTFVA
jgi:hypothetical protein